MAGGGNGRAWLGMTPDPTQAAMRASLVLKSASVQSWGSLAVSLVTLPWKKRAHLRGGKHLGNTEKPTLIHCRGLQELEFSILQS